MGGVYGSTKNAGTRLAKFASEVPRSVAKELAPLLDEEAHDMFANDTDVYKRPFAPLKPSTIRRKRGNSVPLYRTGKLGPGTNVRYAGQRLAFNFGPKAEHAQDGDPGKRAPRMLAPAHGPPAHWRKLLAEAAARAAKRRAK